MMTARFFRSRRLSQIVFVAKIAVAVLVLARQLPAADPEPPSKSLGPVPQSARLAFEEDWKSGKIDAEKWYRPRKQWGQGNNGVVPENVRIEQDLVRGRRKNVLVCEAHGDRYDGPILGWQGRKTRVGGLIVSKPFFASGRFEVVMKIGSGDARKAGPENPNRPRGAVPAIWTYGYRWVEGNAKRKTEFLAETPLYNPHMPAYGIAGNEYWSEIDFPELGKNGDLTKGLYNTFCQNRHDWKTFDVPDVADGRYHTFTTIWRTRLKPLEGVADNQTVKHLGHWWIRDRNVPFDSYLGNPLKRLGQDRYAVYQGEKATHWIDGKNVGENTRHVPAMAGQLNLGIWLPKWAGPAPWKTSRVSFASVQVWQYGDPGDVRNVLINDIPDNFEKDGREKR